MNEGKRRVRADLAAAVPAGGATPPTPPPPPPPKYLTARFHVKGDGVWMDRGDDKPQLWICPRLEPIAETEDDDGYFGMLWAWRDRFGRERQEVFAREQFSGEAGEVCRAMGARGLTPNPARDARQAFVEYLALASSTKRARVVSRSGWHSIGGKLVYVLPTGEVFGSPALLVILQTSSREANLFQQSGTLADWGATIGRSCIGNARLGLAVCMAFAPGLLLPAGEEGGGVSIYGDSRSGKTTCGIVSASVYGGDPAGGGARAAVRTWRATSNSVEAIAAQHSDSGLVLDELGQADAKEIGHSAYMLASGMGKARLDRGAGLRAALTWRVMFLSTGELTLAAKMAEAGIKMRAGQGVRIVDLPADEGAGMGAFRDLHDADSPGAFAKELREAAGKYYGTAFRAFIKALVVRMERDGAAFHDHVRDEIDRLATAWLKPHGEHSGQVRTVARRFALIAVAGNLATEFSITGWGITETGEREAEWSARTCFAAWLAERGGTGSHEDAQAVAQLRAFVSRHGGGRFERWHEKDAADQTEQEGAAPAERYPTQQRAGWRKWVNGEWLYLLTADGMAEALAGLNYKAALQMLADRKLITHGPGKEISHSLSPPGAKKQRLYVVPAAVISAGMAPAAGDD
jgi:putative DNA primase/helicase